ncbi:MAG: M1 family aminopeptidase [Salibacter sp.]|uniref:M1 family aminopeptidase n=1 Tax=Salibacter sp. TaxID=2010995 RepID=UPI0028708CA4|nr:M1 family aminopeptidase [Salibacter sp.]MDR9399667.1 M1 family aminopeptidase [Salibacter sp.]
MKRLLAVAAVSLTFTSCSLLNIGSEPEPRKVVELDTLHVEEPSPRQPYKAAETRVADLIHTKLDVKFDWEKQYLYGKAWLDFTPYFYDMESFKIDAKGFDVNEVSLVSGSDRNPVDYNYDGSQIEVYLDSAYTRNDTFKLFIEYTAKPNELELKGSSAISDAKGLYFINPLGENPNKPKQIWTQGEPESSSCWFPTIDSPNEKTTQEISITVQEKYKTLSNGKLQYSSLNGDGTRTDVWAQEKRHAPYLFMMAVGEFAVVEDSWRDSMLVDYYVEPEYEEHAQAIFGDTPEMIEFYSELFDYPYPWAKYSQVVVRDYVSGAMENTSAVIFGEFAQKTKRELIDNSPEDVIAHELIHHWFGDLVTCESWANLPLNESFATYGEYLWREYKYGRASADMHLHQDLQGYLREFDSGKHVDLIRFNHDKPGDMFDGHSYAKGGRVLHMLRKYLGDEAFFAGLSHYLKENKYEPVEIHQLRLAMEEVSGRDLNWFFNQWFLDEGHPQLTVQYDYIDSTGVQKVMVTQDQDATEFPIYKLPVIVAFHMSNGATIEREIEIDSLEQTFSFDFRSEPEWINFDMEKMLLAEIDEQKPVEDWVAQYNESSLFYAKLTALNEIQKHLRKNDEAAKTAIAALDDSISGIQEKALSMLKVMPAEYDTTVVGKLKKLSKNDEDSEVRSTAINLLPKYADEEVVPLLENALKDSSYYVLVSALDALYKIAPEKGLEKAGELEGSENGEVLMTVAGIYLEEGVEGKQDYFLSLDKKIKGFSRISYMSLLSNYSAEIGSDQFRDKALKILDKEANADQQWFVLYYAVDGMVRIRDAYQTELETINEKYGEEESMEQEDADRVKAIEAKLADIEDKFEVLREKIEHPRVQMLLN